MTSIEDRGERTARRGLRNGIQNLSPAYFGFIMSTGIVSIAFRGLGYAQIAHALAVFNVGCYLLLLLLLGVRIARFPSNVVADLRDPGRRWAALTFVVGTNTVGVQLILFFDRLMVALLLWLFAAVVTPLLLYFLIVTEIIRSWDKPVRERINGAFLLSIVSMQALATLGALLADTLTEYANTLILTSMAYWGSGFVLYFIVITLVSYRLLAGTIKPSDWTGPYWITMGAAAITTLAGATIGPRLGAIPGWESYGPSMLTITFLAWGIASWWIPVLLVIDVWKFTSLNVDESTPGWIAVFPWARLGFGRQFHSYEPGDWGRVFPMGMYTACSINLAGVHAFNPLMIIPQYWGWFALVVWGLTLVGTIRAAVRVVSPHLPIGSPASS